MTGPNADQLLDQVRAMVADVFGSRLDRITADSSPQTVEGWDSLHHLNLILALEERFAIQIDPFEAAELVSVAAIVEALRQKLG